MLFALTSKFLIHLKLILYLVGGKHPTLVVVPAPYVEKTIFPPLDGRGSHVENQLTIDVWVYFWALYPIPVMANL